MKVVTNQLTAPRSHTGESPARGSFAGTRLALATLALALFTLAAAGCAPERPANAAEPAGAQSSHALPAVAVECRPVERRDDAGYLEAVGRVKNVQESTVASKAMGKVQEVAVKAGEQVEEGQVLLRIDDRDARAMVDRAKAGLAQANAARRITKRMFDRYEKLTLSQSAAEAKHDQAFFEYRRALGAVAEARAARESAESYLSETVVRAPFGGRVVDTLIEPGEMASPGRPLLRLEGDASLEFEATINGRDVSLVQVGSEVVVVLDADGGEQREVQGTVSEIVPTSDPVTHSNLVRIGLHQSEGVRTGAFGRVRFARQRQACAGILVDADRVLRRGQLSAVYVVDADERVRLRLVKEGRTVNHRAEILSGLREGDRFVVSPTDRLVDGQPARVQTVSTERPVGAAAAKAATPATPVDSAPAAAPAPPAAPTPATVEEEVTR